MILTISILVIWCTAVILQFYYWIFPLPEPSAVADQPFVSVLVCTNQAGFQLHRVITQLQAQNYPNFEVIIVNDGPSQDIALYLRTIYWDRLRVVSYDRLITSVPGKKAPLTAGINTAKGSWILLTDVDCVPGPEWITAMVRSRGSADLILGFSPLLKQPGLLNMMQRFDGLLIAVQYFGAALRNAPYMGVGRNLLYRKSVFEAVGGFSGHANLLSGDDDLLIQSAASNHRIGIATDPASFVHAEAPGSWSAWIAQKRRHLSASVAYTRDAQWRSAGFAVSWFVVWSGLPVVLIFTQAQVAILLSLCILWSMCARQALRFRQATLIPLIPLLAICYSVVQLIFGVLLIQKPTQRWS